MMSLADCLCGKATDSLAHVLAGYSALAQNKYLTMHNAALKILFFEIPKVMKLANTFLPWYWPKVPDRSTSLWRRKHSGMSRYMQRTTM